MSLYQSTGSCNKSRRRQAAITRAAHAGLESLESRQLLSGAPTTDLLDVVLQEPGGRVVMAGRHSTFNGFDIVRFNPDATADPSVLDVELDPSFGVGGHAAISVLNFIPVDMVEDAGGNIYIAGNVGAQDFAVVKLSSTGILDTSFGTGGVTQVDFGGFDSVKQILLQNITVGLGTEPRLVLAGTADSTQFGLARLNLAGVLDTTFDSDGKVTTPIGTAAALNDVIADGDALIAGGSSDITGINTFTLARYQADGALDTAFGQSGIMTPDAMSPLGSDPSEIVSLADNGGNLLAIGYGGFFSGVAMLQIDKATGNIDLNFADAGQYVDPGITDFSPGTFSIAGVGGNSVIVTGEWTSASALLYGAVRYELSATSVSRDLTYGGGISTDGVAPADMGNSTIFRKGLSAHVLSDGRVLVGASADPMFAPDSNFDAMLLKADGTPEQFYSIGFFENADTNVAPVVDPIVGPASGTAGTPLDFSGAYSDPNDDSPHTLAWSVSDGQTGTGSTFTWTPQAAGQFTVTFTVTDGGGLNDSAALDVTVVLPNAAPIVDPIVGPTSGTAGTPLNFSGAYSDPNDNSAHTLAWSVSDGQTGTGPNFQWTPTAAGDYVVTFTVTDGGNLSGSATLSVTVTAPPNVAPVVDPIVGPGSGLWGTQFNFSGSFSDPGDASLHSLAWTVSSGAQVIASGQGATFAWTLGDVGTYTVTFLVTDGGGLSNSASKSVTVTSAVLSNGLLQVQGSAGANALSISHNQGVYVVSVDGQAVQNFNATLVNSIVIAAGSGDDLIIIGSGVTANAEIHGGAGDDLITGGAGDDILLGETGNDLLMGRNGSDIFVGGAGNDLLMGGNGQDILIGGAGNDVIVGDNGSDLLIAGLTTHDAVVSELAAIRTIWAGGADYLVRVNTLQAGLLSPQSILDDGSLDLLSGDNGRDWIIANTVGGVRDLMLGVSRNEIITDLP